MRRWTCAWVGLVGLGLAPGARGDETIGEATARLAGQVKAFLDQNELTGVTLGTFQGQNEAVGTPGSGVELAFKQALEHKGVLVKEQASVALVGKVTPVEVRGTGAQALKLTVELQRKNDVPRTFEASVRNRAQVSEALGASVAFPPGARPRDHDLALKKAIEAPAPALAGGLVRAPGGPLYAIEMLVAPPHAGKTPHLESEYRAVVPVDKDGLAFAEVPRGHVYAVRIVNEADHDVAVALKIDGLSMFVTSEVVVPKFSHVVVRKKGSAIVRGWFVDLKNTDEFLVGSLADSVAQQLKETAKVGLVSATFHAAWPADQPPPPDEPPSSEANRQGADATGRGARAGVAYEEAKNLKVGAFRAVVSVRYARP